MSKDILIKYADYCKKLTANDRKKLSNLKEYITDGTIEYMLEHDVKLEQEIVEIEDIKIIWGYCNLIFFIGAVIKNNSTWMIF